MKILQTQTAPNPRRVRIFLAEKGIEVPYEELDLMKGALKTPEFTKLNPLPARAGADPRRRHADRRDHGHLPLFRGDAARAGPVRQRARGSGPWWRCGTGAWSSICCSVRGAGLPPPASGHGAARGAAGVGVGRGQQAQGAGDARRSWTRSWRTRPYHRRRRLLGRRHHRAGGGRLHAGRRASSGPRSSKNLDALARRGVGAAEREGLRSGWRQRAEGRAA